MQAGFNMELLIKKIQTKNRFYIYDVNSNQIIEVEKIFFDLVSSFGKIEKTEIIKKFSPGCTNDEISDCLEVFKELPEDI